MQNNNNNVMQKSVTHVCGLFHFYFISERKRGEKVHKSMVLNCYGRFCHKTGNCFNSHFHLLFAVASKCAFSFICLFVCFDLCSFLHIDGTFVECALHDTEFFSHFFGNMTFFVSILFIVPFESKKHLHIKV